MLTPIAANLAAVFCVPFPPMQTTQSLSLIHIYTELVEPELTESEAMEPDTLETETPEVETATNEVETTVNEIEATETEKA